MTAPPLTPRPLSGARLWILSFALWTVFGVLSATQIYVRDATSGAHASVLGVIDIVYFYWAWALVTPLTLRLAAPLLADDVSWTRRAMRLLPAMLIVLALQSVLYALFSVLADGAALAAVPAKTALNVTRHLAGNVLTYVTLVAGYAAVERIRQAGERERDAARLALRASELESLLARMRLEAFKAQLHPHFLFNTLNMISGLVAKRDAVTANRAIARLGELLRATLAPDAAHEIPLDRELDLARRYLEIAQLRFGSRLVVRESIDADVLAARVPTLILQPLIENSLRHGIAARAVGGCIELVAARRGDELELRVLDDGPGFPPTASTAAGGVGLANVRDRLAQMYGLAACLETANRPERGAVVTIRLPFRAGAEPVSAAPAAPAVAGR